MIKDIIKEQMITAMKSGDKKRKLVLSMIFSALQTNEKNEEKRRLTEDAVISKELKQAKETLTTANGREDIVAEAEYNISVIEEFAPKQMDDAQVLEFIQKTALKLGLENPTITDKGTLMKAIMIALKDEPVKADGNLVGSILTEFLTPKESL